MGKPTEFNKPIDFKSIARVALAQGTSLLAQWLPDGVLNGAEYKATNPTRSDHKAGSFSVNVVKGVWSDFATGEKGSDFIDLYAYLFNVNNGKAAIEVAKAVGYSMDSVAVNAATSAPARAVGGGQEAVAEVKSRGNFVSVTPVPQNAVRTAPKNHFKRGAPTHRWAYRNEAGELLGYVCRFTTSDGGKEVLPLVFARDVRDGSMKWTWVQWAEPRPLYLAGLNFAHPVSLDYERTLVIVEGEKCADALAKWLMERDFSGALIDVVSWSGGCKAVKKADWSQVAQYRSVILWPDRDLKSDKEGAVLDVNLQPGFKAMLDVAAALKAAGVPEIKFIVTNDLGDSETDGFDAADAVERGMNIEALFLQHTMSYDEALSLGGEPKNSAQAQGSANAGKAKSIREASAQRVLRDGRGQEFADLAAKMYYTKSGVRACRENVFYALSDLSDWRDAIAFDEFANRTVKTRKLPFDSQSRDWTNADDLQLSLWLAENVDLLVSSLSVLTEGVSLAAHCNRIHPPRDYLNSLKWDGQERLDVWLVGTFGAKEKTRNDGEYLRLAGRKFMIGAVGRIFEPGCQFDNMIVLEGDQGRGKSTAIRILFGEWFSDTYLDLQNKDAYAQLDGIWGYEIAEMGSFSRAEDTRVKAFVTSRKDRYRAAFERRPEDHARSTVFIGTTNQDEYLKDPTGARRFWPVCVTDSVDFEWLRTERDQLWAEAVTKYREGEQWHVTAEEQRDIFGPEQAERSVPDGWLEHIAKWLNGSDDMDYRIAQGITMGDVLKALNFAPDKLTATKQESGRITAVMKTLGFVKKRAATADSNGYRGYIYVKQG